VNPAQVVEVLASERDFSAGDAIADRVRRLGPLQGGVEGRPVHRAVEVRQPLRPLADQRTQFGTPIQGQLEPLEQLGSVDRVEEARPARIDSAPLFFQQSVDREEVAEVRLAGVGLVTDADLQEERRHPLVEWVGHVVSQGGPAGEIPGSQGLARRVVQSPTASVVVRSPSSDHETRSWGWLYRPRHSRR
jgi:hypothetical protein